MDPIPISGSFSRSTFNWATSGLSTRIFSDPGLGATVFRFESLAVATGLEAVFRDGGVGEGIRVRFGLTQKLLLIINHL